MELDVKTRMSQRMGGHTKKHGIQNTIVRDKIGITENILESCLRYSMEKSDRNTSNFVSRVDYVENSLIMRECGRPKKTISQTHKKDLKLNNMHLNFLSKNMHLNFLWCQLIAQPQPMEKYPIIVNLLYRIPSQSHH